LLCYLSNFVGLESDIIFALYPVLNINEKIAFSAGFDIFFFGAKIRGRSSNFSGLLGRYEIKENFLYSKPLKFRIDLSGVKQG
jgi:hypothetical protein